MCTCMCECVIYAQRDWQTHHVGSWILVRAISSCFPPWPHRRYTFSTASSREKINVCVCACREIEGDMPQYTWCGTCMFPTVFWLFLELVRIWGFWPKWRCLVRSTCPALSETAAAAGGRTCDYKFECERRKIFKPESRPSKRLDGRQIMAS